MTQQSSVEMKPTGGVEQETPKEAIPVDTDRTVENPFGQGSFEENTPHGGALEMIPFGFLGC